MGVTINYTNSHLDYFARNLIVGKCDGVATAHGYVSAERIALLTSSPDELPISVSDAKDHIEFVSDDEDAKVEAWIRDAWAKLERDTGLALLGSRWRVTIEQFPSFRQSLYLPVWPVQAIDSLVYFDRDNNEQSVETSPGDFILVTSKRPAALGLVDSGSWPTSTRKFHPGTLELTAGWASPEDIPRDLLAALKKLIGDFAGFRESMVAAPSQVQSAPQTYDDLIAPWVLPGVA